MLRLPVWLLLGTTLLLAACAGAKRSATVDKPSKEEGTVLENLDESFDTAALNEPEYPIKPKVREPGEDVLARLQASKVDTVESTSLLGYRIQILQTEDAEEARKVQKDAILELDTDVYLIYDEPYYKVRVGDFRTRYEAETFLEKVHKRGYSSAWIVRTRINPSAHQ